MTLAQALIAFLIAGTLLTITPGVDTLMVLRTATVEGPRRAILAATGICIGCLAWGAAVALGIGAMIAAAPALFTALRWAGAAYLAWIGIGMMLRPRDRLGVKSEEANGMASENATLWLRRGLVTNLFNPKIGLFYIAFLPQFVPAGYAPAGFIFLLACLHVLMTVVWFALLIGASLPLGRLFARSGVVRAMDRITGGLFVALGARIALTR